LHVSPNIITVIISRILRWEGHVACTGELRNAYKILIGKPEELEYNIRTVKGKVVPVL
jgi:hypothetical protein